MDPELYTIISQGISLMNVIAAKAQQDNYNPESVKLCSGELQRSVRSLLKVHEEEFSSEGWRRYNATLSEINDTAMELAEDCQDPTAVMQLTGGNLKTLLIQLGEVLEGERPEIRGKSFFERMKERFGN